MSGGRLWLMKQTPVDRAEEGVGLKSLWRKSGQDVVNNGRRSHLLSWAMVWGREVKARHP